MVIKLIFFEKDYEEIQERRVMFGYLKLDKDELKLKHIKKYQSIYCGLCKSLRAEYGMLYAMFLNYESVFLYFYLELISDILDETEVSTRCPLNPLIKKHITFNKEIMEYVSFINLLLVEFKCRDDIQDEKSFLKRVLNKIISRNMNFVKEREKHKELLVMLEDIIHQFNEKEKLHCSIDECMSSMGSFLQCIISYFAATKDLESSTRTELLMIANDIGKWIYVIDAFDDLEADERKNSFNPLLQIEDKEADTEYRQKVSCLMLQMITIDVSKRLQELEISDCDIVENILYHGLQKTLKKILIKKEKRRRQQFKVQEIKGQIKSFFSIK